MSVSLRALAMRADTFLKIVLVVLLGANVAVAETHVDSTYSVAEDKTGTFVGECDVDDVYQWVNLQAGVIIYDDGVAWRSVDNILSDTDGITGNGSPYNIEEIIVDAAAPGNVAAIVAAASGTYNILGEIRITATRDGNRYPDLYGFYFFGDFSGTIDGGAITIENRGNYSGVYGVMFERDTTYRWNESADINGQVKFGNITIFGGDDWACGLSAGDVSAGSSLTLGDIFIDSYGYGISVESFEGTLKTGTITVNGTDGQSVGISSWDNFTPQEDSEIGKIHVTGLQALGIRSSDVHLLKGVDLEIIAVTEGGYNGVAYGISSTSVTLANKTDIWATNIGNGATDVYGINTNDLTVTGTVNIKADAANDTHSVFGVGNWYEVDVDIKKGGTLNIENAGFGIMTGSDLTIFLEGDLNINSTHASICTGAFDGLGQYYRRGDLTINVKSGGNLDMKSGGFDIQSGRDLTINFDDVGKLTSKATLVSRHLNIFGPGTADLGILAMTGYDDSGWDSDLDEWVTRWIPPGNITVSGGATLAFDLFASEPLLGNGTKTFTNGGKFGVYSKAESLENSGYKFHLNGTTGQWFFGSSGDDYESGIDWNYDPIYEWGLNRNNPNDPFLFVKRARESANRIVSDGFLAAAGMHRRYAAWRAVQPHLISGEGTYSFSNPFSRSAYRGQANNKTLFGCPIVPQSAWVQYTNRSDAYRSSYNDKDWKLTADGIQMGVDLYNRNRTRSTPNLCDDPCVRTVCGTQFGLHFGYERGKLINDKTTTDDAVAPEVPEPKWPFIPARKFGPMNDNLYGDAGSGNGNGKSNGNGNNRLTMDDFYFGFYGAHVFRNDFDIRCSFAGGWQHYKMRRTHGQDRYTAKFQGYTTETNLEVGKRLGTGLWSVRPLIGVDLMTNDLQSAKETGGTLPLTYAKTNLTQIFVRPGMELRFQEDRVTVNGGVFYAYEMSGNTLRTRITTNGVDWVPLDGPLLGRNLVMFNLGGMYQMSTHFALFGGYQGEYVADRENKVVQNVGYGGGIWRW